MLIIVSKKIQNIPLTETHQKGWLATRPLGKLCLWQVYLFAGVLVLFAIFVLFYRHTTCS